MPTIAIVGAGPGLGLALAKTFGGHGYDVALVSRNEDNLAALVEQLTAEGVTAAAFAADVLDRRALTEALERAAAHFGGIDVLEFSPVDKTGGAVLSKASQTTPEDVQAQLEAQLYGALTATRAVLPAMVEAGAGTLLFTTGAGSITPVVEIANVNAAAAALRNWVVNLHGELKGSGVYAAHVGIDVSIDVAMMPGFPVVPAAQVATAYWALHQERQVAELVYSGS